MQETLIVCGLFMLGFALRASRISFVRKLGAAVFVATTYLLFYYLSGRVWFGIFGASLWFFLPWIDLFLRVRKLHLPMDNRLTHRPPPDPTFFPNALESEASMEDEGFEHAADCGWEWIGMQQFFKLFWNPEEMAVSAVCLCEQSEVAFAFMNITSYGKDGLVYRTTNFPFAPTLKRPPHVHWNHVPCERNSFRQILSDHQAFLKKRGINQCSLRMPDPDTVERLIECEMKCQIEHNLKLGIIRQVGERQFRYSKRGLVYLWGQYIKDMIRLC